MSSLHAGSRGETRYVRSMTQFLSVCLSAVRQADRQVVVQHELLFCHVINAVKLIIIINILVLVSLSHHCRSCSFINDFIFNLYNTVIII